jgi:hypothetical protein
MGIRNSTQPITCLAADSLPNVHDSPKGINYFYIGGDETGCPVLFRR